MFTRVLETEEMYVRLLLIYLLFHGERGMLNTMFECVIIIYANLFMGAVLENFMSYFSQALCILLSKKGEAGSPDHLHT